MALAVQSEVACEPCVIANKYQLETLLSEGGMGTIWRARNLQLEVPVAIKLLRAELDEAALRERLRVEARVAAKLVHPSIVRVFDIGDAESGEPFIVMELLEGESLGERLERGPLPATEAVRLLLPIAEGLILAHLRGVVHRDLKPDNIFLARAGTSLQPKLLDFGIAKLPEGADEAARDTLTRMGSLLGSPRYMSPEQAHGSTDLDLRADIWSFCVVLYEAIAGRHVFQGEDLQQILLSVLQDEPKPLNAVADVDARLSQIVLQGLAKEREQRPGSMFELGQRLATWLLAQGIHEDATGASLEAKWLGRGVVTPVPPSLDASSSAVEQPTLVSVSQPKQWVTSTVSLPVPGRSGRDWLTLAAAVGLVLLPGLGWATWHRVGTGRDEPATTAVVEPAPEPSKPHLAAAVPVVALEALPTEPAARAVPSEPRRRPPRVARKIESKATTTAATSPRPGHPRREPEPPAAVERDPASELLDPY